MLKSITLIFEVYGGWRVFLKSSYLWTSFVISLLLWRSVLNEEWGTAARDILPSLIGFSIAAIAIITVIGDDGFRRALSAVKTINGSDSDLSVVLAGFCWFIFVQIIVLIYSLVYLSKPIPSICEHEVCNCDLISIIFNFVLGFLGQWGVIYAMTLVLATVFQTFQLFKIYINSLQSER